MSKLSSLAGLISSWGESGRGMAAFKLRRTAFIRSRNFRGHWPDLSTTLTEVQQYKLKHPGHVGSSRRQQANPQCPGM